MNLNWLESIIYGLFSGISEFMPISSSAHQAILLHLFGADGRDPIRDLIVHISLLIAVYTSLKTTLDTLYRENSQRSHMPKLTYVVRTYYDIHLVKNAIIPMVIGLFLITYTFRSSDNLLTMSLLLILNGIVLFLPERMMQGNKDAHSMSLLDSVLLSVSGALSALPGLSRIGCMTSISMIRGANRQNALYWALLLSIPAIAALICLDFLGIITLGERIPFFSNFFMYILSAIFAYIGSYLGIRLMRFLAASTGYSCFAYYSWGTGLFTFLVYLTVV